MKILALGIAIGLAIGYPAAVALHGPLQWALVSMRLRKASL